MFVCVFSNEGCLTVRDVKHLGVLVGEFIFLVFFVLFFKKKKFRQVKLMAVFQNCPHVYVLVSMIAKYLLTLARPKTLFESPPLSLICLPCCKSVVHNNRLA